MKKSEAAQIITSCAKLYNENLENKNFLFIFNDKNNIQYLETLFLPRNYKHLTGVESSSKAVKSSDFYNLCLSGRLSPDDFELHKNGTTDMKLSVLPQVMNIHKNAKMIGNFNSIKFELITEKIIGTVTACIGFVCENNFYVPNTVLREDTRTVVETPAKRIIAIFQKEIREQHYCINTYLAKGISLEYLLSLDNLKSKINLII
jgi:hypothetical protein